MNDWTGRTAVITGAASGFGLEASRVDAARGMNLVMADVQREAPDTAAAEIRGLGAQVLACRFDVSCWHQQRSIAKASGVWRQATGSFRISHLARTVTGAGRVLPANPLNSLPETCQSSWAAIQPTFV